MSDENNSPYSLTLKAATGYDAPWLVIRADSIEQLHDRVKAVDEHAFFATAGNAARQMQAAYRLGSQLGAEPVSPPKEPAKTKGKSAAKSQPKAAAEAEPAKTETESPWEAEPSLVKEEPKAAPAAAPSTTGRPKPAWKK